METDIKGFNLARKDELRNDLDNYATIGALNKEAMSVLVQKLKGNDSLDALASTSGVNKSTLSRIINKLVDDNVSKSVMAGLIIAAESMPERGVNRTDLLEANKMYEKKDAQTTKTSLYEKTVIQSIVSKLVLDGYKVEAKISDKDSYEQGWFQHDDLTVKTSAIKDGEWVFSVKNALRPNGSSRNLPIDQVVMQVFSRLYTSVKSIGRYSIVTNDFTVCNRLFEAFERYNLHDVITIIYTSNDGSQIIDEMIPKNCSGKNKKIFSAESSVLESK